MSRRTILDQSGLSLPEILVSLGLFGILSLGIAEVTVGITKVQRRASTLDTFNLIVGQAAKIFQDESLCSNALATQTVDETDASGNGSPITLAIQSGSSILAPFLQEGSYSPDGMLLFTKVRLVPLQAPQTPLSISYGPGSPEQAYRFPETQMKLVIEAQKQTGDSLGTPTLYHDEINTPVVTTGTLVSPNHRVLYCSGPKTAQNYSLCQNHRQLLRYTLTGSSPPQVNVSCQAACTGASLSSLSEDPNGNLFASGTCQHPGGWSGWITRRSGDHGVTWSTVDLYDHKIPGVSMPSALPIKSDSTGVLYQAGSFYSGINYKSSLLMRISLDGGTTWKTVDDYQYKPGKDTAAWGRLDFVIDPSDRVFVAMSAKDNSGFSHWLVRMSSDHGATWSIVDDYLYPTYDNTYASSMTLDAAGNPVVIGYSSTNFSQTARSLIRRSTDGGATWTTIDDYYYTQAANGSWHTAFGIELISIPPTTFYASVTTNAPCDAAHAPCYSGYTWATRLSTDNGATWKTIDFYKPGLTYQDSYTSQANDGTINPPSFFLDNFKNLYTIGFYHDKNNQQHNVARQAWPDGLGFNPIIDIPTIQGGTTSSVGRLNRDWVGNLYFASQDTWVSATVMRSKLMRSKDNGNSWAEVASVDLPVGQGHSTPSGLLVDQVGNIHFAVNAFAAGGLPNQWVIQRSTDNGVTWAQTEAFSN